MNSVDFQGKTSFTCTCTHGGAGLDGQFHHMPACDFFVPTKEQYAEAVAERDKLRVVAKAAQAWGEQDTPVDQEYVDKIIDALDALNVKDPITGRTVRPWWMRT